MGLDSSPTREASDPGDSPARFAAQWNKLFGQEPSNIDDSTVPDLRLDTLGQDDDEFGSFFSAAAKNDKKDDHAAILPSQLFDLDQSLFSQQTTRQGKIILESFTCLQANDDDYVPGPHDLLSDFPMPSPARPSSVQKQLDLLHQKEEESRALELLDELQMGSGTSLPKPVSSTTKQSEMSQWFSLFADLDPLANPDAIGKTTKESDPNCYS